VGVGVSVGVGVGVSVGVGVGVSVGVGVGVGASAKFAVNVFVPKLVHLPYQFPDENVTSGWLQLVNTYPGLATGVPMSNIVFFGTVPLPAPVTLPLAPAPDDQATFLHNQLTVIDAALGGIEKVNAA
jgi:hypothetical protein